MTPLDPELKKRNTDVCKKCRSEIIWATTQPRDGKPGKPIPVDPELVHGGNINIDVDDVGMFHVRLVRPAGDVEAYVTHFSTCPNAAEFRKPAEGASHDEQNAARRRALLVRMPFGQFSGQTLEEIDRHMRGHEYLRWLHREGVRMPDLRQAIAAVLGVDA